MSAELSQELAAPALVEEAPPTRRKSNWLGWGLALLIIASCFLFVDLESLLAAMRELTLPVVLGLVLLSTTERFLRGCNWAFLLRIVGVRTPLLRVVRYFYQGSFSGVFLPTHVGGDLLRAWWVIRDGGPGHPVFASLLVERLLGLAAGCNWAILGGIIFAIQLHPEGATLYVALGTLAAIGTNLLFAFVMSQRLHAFVLQRLGRFSQARILGVVHKLYEAFASFSSDPRRLLLNALLATTVTGLQIALFVGIAVGIGATTDVLVFFAAASLHSLIYKIPIAPDGWGVGELTAIAIYGLIGVSAAEAFAIGVIGHIIPVLALSPGFLFLLFGDRLPGAAAAARDGPA